MSEEIQNCIQVFADDTKLNRTVPNVDIKKFEEWSNKWQIHFNASKCEVMDLGQKNIRFAYKMGNTKLEETLVGKDLGVYIDNDLNFNFHIQKSIMKANRMLGLI